MWRLARPSRRASGVRRRIDMADRRSSISRLPAKIREQINRLIRDGAMIDEIVAHLKTLDVQVSRSAVGRFKQSAEATMRRYREAQEIAEVWVRELGERPQGDIGRLVAEALRTATFGALARIEAAAEAGTVDGKMGDKTTKPDCAASPGTGRFFRPFRHHKNRWIFLPFYIP